MQDLPMEVAVQIAGHLAAMSVSPMDDLRSLRATCRFLCGVTRDRAVGQCIDVRRFTAAMLWNNIAAYATHLAHLTDISNPEACYVTGMNNAFSKGTLRPGHASLSLPAPSIVGTMWPPSSSSGPIPVPPLTKLRGGTFARSRATKKRRRGWGVVRFRQTNVEQRGLSAVSRASLRPHLGNSLAPMGTSAVAGGIGAVRRPSCR